MGNSKSKHDEKSDLYNLLHETDWGTRGLQQIKAEIRKKRLFMHSVCDGERLYLQILFTLLNGFIQQNRCNVILIGHVISYFQMEDSILNGRFISKFIFDDLAFGNTRQVGALNVPTENRNIFEILDQLSIRMFEHRAIIVSFKLALKPYENRHHQCQQVSSAIEINVNRISKTHSESDIESGSAPN